MRAARFAVLLVAVAADLAAERAVETPVCSAPYSIKAVAEAPADDMVYGPDIVLREDGRPVIAFYGREAGSGVESLYVHSCLDRACSPGVTRRLEASSFIGAGYPRIFLQPNGFPVIVNANEVALNVFECTDATCSSGVNRAITAPWSNTPNFAAAQRADGRPVIVYFEPYEDKLRMVTCDDPACTTFVDRSIVQPAGFARADIPRVAIGPDQRPIVVANFTTEDGPWIVSYEAIACESAACEAPVRTKLSDQFSYWPSIAVRSGGLPVIHEAFNDPEAVNGTRFQLRYCDDFSCSTSSVKSPQAAFPSELTSAVTLDVDDAPVVTMFGFNWGYIRCVDAACSDAERVTLGGTTLGGLPDIAHPYPATASAVLPAFAVENNPLTKIYAAVCSEDDLHRADAEQIEFPEPVYVQPESTGGH